MEKREEEILRSRYFETVGHFKIQTNSRSYHAKFFDEDGEDFYIVKLFNNRYKRIRKSTVVCFGILFGSPLPDGVEINEHLFFNSMTPYRGDIDLLEDCSTIVIDDDTEVEHMVFENEDDCKKHLIDSIYND